MVKVGRWVEYYFGQKIGLKHFLPLGVVKSQGKEGEKFHCSINEHTGKRVIDKTSWSVLFY